MLQDIKEWLNDKSEKFSKHYISSDTEPEDKTKLWINLNNYLIYEYRNRNWEPVAEVRTVSPNDAYEDFIIALKNLCSWADKGLEANKTSFFNLSEEPVLNLFYEGNNNNLSFIQMPNGVTKIVIRDFKKLTPRKTTVQW